MCVRKVLSGQHGALDVGTCLLVRQHAEDHTSVGQPLHHPWGVLGVGVPRLVGTTLTTGFCRLGLGFQRPTPGEVHEGIRDGFEVRVAELQWVAEELQGVVDLLFLVVARCEVGHLDDDVHNRGSSELGEVGPIERGGGSGQSEVQPLRDGHVEFVPVVQ